MPRKKGATHTSCASSCSPLISNVGIFILCTSSTTDQVFSDPTTVNSDGPFLSRLKSAAVPQASQSRASPHGKIRRIIPLQPIQRIHNVVRKGHHPAQVLLVENKNRRFVLRILVRPVSLMP